MLYTSGTTGRPEGRAALAPRRARGGARAARAAASCGRATARSASCRSTTRWACAPCSPRAPAAGSSAASPSSAPTPALDAVERERLTSLYLAPTLFHDLVAAQRERPRDVSSVRALAYAGAPMTGVLVERCVEAFAPEAFVNHYGSTEIYTFTIHGDQRAKPGCAGRAALNARIRLVEPVPGASPDAEVAAGRGRSGGLRALERRGLRGLLAATRCRRAPDQGRLVLPGRPRPARRRRRPLPRRPHRRHDRLGRRERAPARDRGVARAPPGRGRGRRRGRGGRAPRPARRGLRRVRAATSRRTRSTRTAWPRRRSRASSGRATTVSSTRCPKSASGKLLRRMLRTTEGTT